MEDNVFHSDTLEYRTDSVTTCRSIAEAWGGRLCESVPADGGTTDEDKFFTAEWGESAWIQGTIAATLLILLVSLRKIVAITPSLLGAFVRVKENFNIEDSLHIRTTRNRVALISVLSMTIIGARYRLIPYALPGIGQSPEAILAITASFIIMLWAYRTAATAVFIRTAGKERTYKVARGTSYTYFTIATAFAYIIAACFYVFGGKDPEMARKAILAGLALVYLIFFIREIQIFIQTSRSAYSTFLYLCTLEIIPAAIVVLPALLLK